MDKPDGFVDRPRADSQAVEVVSSLVPQNDGVLAYGCAGGEDRLRPLRMTDKGEVCVSGTVGVDSVVQVNGDVECHGRLLEELVGLQKKQNELLQALSMRLIPMVTVMEQLSDLCRELAEAKVSNV